MNSIAIQELINRWQAGQLDWATVDVALRAAYADTAATAEAMVDLDRLPRCGYPEVVFGTGKTPEAVVSVFRAQQTAGQNSLATRVTPEQVARVSSEFPDSHYNEVARTISVMRQASDSRGRVVVVTAGTSDRPVAEEALETVRWMGCTADLLVDVGVAGPHRLLAHRHRFDDADAVVVVAGMEGALPSVVAGWVAAPVIAVPTSVGYGANFGGVAALLGMLNSCAANVAVVNIDAGFKGGYLASVIARRSAAAVQ